MAAGIWRFAEFEFHESSLELSREGEPVPAEAKAREVLCYMLRYADNGVLSHRDIKKGVWGSTHVSDSSVNVAINKIRDAFGDNNRERIIRTVRGGGYALTVEAVEVSEPERSPKPEFSVGQPVPGRPGWLLTQRIYADQYRETWLTGQSVVVQVAWEKTGLELLRAEARVHSVLRSDASARSFTNLVGAQFETVPYLLETEYLGLTLPAWAAQEKGLGKVSESLRVGIVAAVASALDMLHSLGEVHGALSAECIHLLKQADEWIVRIDGFGHYVHGFAPNGEFYRLPGAPNLQSRLCRAPEQEEQAHVTQEGDIYSLGVLLYQCVACNLSEGPMLGWEARIPDPVLRRDIAETANINPAMRTRKPAELAKDLRDLAARRLAEERLAESRRLNEDLELKLAMELAKRPLRHALAAALTLLAVVLAVTALLDIRALQHDRDKAQEEKRDGQTLQKFFERLFFDGDATVRGPLTAEELIERGLDTARVLKGVPRVHAAVLNTLGTGLVVLGRYSKAEAVLDEALQERRKVDGDDAPQVAETLLTQASLKEDEVQPQAALKLAEKALDIEKRKLPSGDIAISRTKTQMAEDLTGLGDYDRAVSLLQESIAQETGHPEMLADLSTALNDLGIAENYRNHMERSIDLQEQSMQIDRAMLGDRHPDIAAHLLSISDAHLLLGQSDQGAAEARQALSIYRESLPAEHQEIAAAEVMLADNLSHLPGKTTEAEAELDPALDILRRGPEVSMTEGHALIVLCRVKRQQGRLAEAIAVDKRALHVYQTLYPQPNFLWTQPLALLADLYVETKQWELAESFAEQAWQNGKATLDSGDPRRLGAQLVLAKVREQQSRSSDASALLNDVLAYAPDGDLRTRAVRRAALAELGLIASEKR